MLPFAASGTQYTIQDVGAPPYSSAVPAAFNNTDQILGVAETPVSTDFECILYNGAGKYLIASPPPNDIYCIANAISSADSKGVVRYTASVLSLYDDTYVALLGSYTTTTGVSNVVTYSSNVPSALGGVNLSGEAEGAAYYDPLSGVASNSFITPPGTTTLTLAQPQCATLQQYCSSASTIGCPFGGCAINDSGMILGVDGFNQKEMVYRYGQPSTAKDLPLPTTAMANPTLNNAEQVLYHVEDSANVHITPYIYSIATGKTIAVPKLSGNTCTKYFALSMSNNGQLLGQTGNCTNLSDSIYWTWDVTHGIQNLNAKIPKTQSLYLYAFGINDAGQILIQFDVGGVTHWGFLNPPGYKAVRP